MTAEACYCDFERPTVYTRADPVARTKHRCYECGRTISPGDHYERVKMLYDGRWDTCDTCPKCLALRRWVQAHVPCFCWLHGSMLENAYEEMENLPEHVPGMWFEFARLYIAVVGRKRKPLHDRHRSA